MRYLELSYQNSFHPNTFGGKAALLAKQYIKEGNLFMATTILKGMGFDVKFLNVKDVQFIQTVESIVGLQSPRLTIKCKKY